MLLSFLEVYDQIRDNFPGKLTNKNVPLDVDQLLQEVLSKSRQVNWDRVFCDGPENISEDDCLKFKQLGTKCFQKNLLAEAVYHYNDYIRHCHRLANTNVNKKQFIFQGFSNRSAILFRAQQFKYCADDILLALSYSDKDPKNEYLLYDRLGKCFSSLDDKEKAEENFDLALRSVEKVTMPEELKNAFKKQVEQSLQNVKVAKKKADQAKTSKVTPDSIGLTPKATIMYNDRQGRYLVAAETITPGEVIAIENPNVSFTHFDANQASSTVCHHCMSPFNTDPRVMYPSPFVDGINFCGRECLEKACGSYHKHEKFIWTDYLTRMKNTKEVLEKSGCMFLAYRAIARYTPTYLKESLQTFLKDDPQFGIDQSAKDLPEEHVKLMTLYNLVRHESALDREEKLRTMIRSVILLECLQRTNYFSNQQFDEKLFIIQLLYRFQLGITLNLHLVYEVCGDLSGDIPLRMVGSAVYHNLILLNHSCAQNTARCYKSGQIILVAKKLIKKGEEITNNYGIHHNNMAKAQRQAALSNGYKFECTCDACTNDFPLLADLNAKVPGKVKKQLDALLSQYQTHFKMGDLINARQACAKYLTKLDQSGIEYPHRNYEIGAIALNSCWWALLADQK